NFTASSVGSATLTSDYDLTFASADSSDDIRGMTEFNARIRALFGRQPGSVFDTNIYLQNYVRVDETLDRALVQEEDNTPFEPGVAIQASVGVRQHAMGLMKMRRTMDSSEWTACTDRVQRTSRLGVGEIRNLDLQYSEAGVMFTLANQRFTDKLRALGVRPEF